MKKLNHLFRKAVKKYNNWVFIFFLFIISLGVNIVLLKSLVPYDLVGHQSWLKYVGYLSTISWYVGLLYLSFSPTILEELQRLFFLQKRKIRSILLVIVKNLLKFIIIIGSSLPVFGSFILGVGNIFSYAFLYGGSWIISLFNISTIVDKTLFSSLTLWVGQFLLFFALYRYFVFEKKNILAKRYLDSAFLLTIIFGVAQLIALFIWTSYFCHMPVLLNGWTPYMTVVVGWLHIYLVSGVAVVNLLLFVDLIAGVKAQSGARFQRVPANSRLQYFVFLCQSVLVIWIILSILPIFNAKPEWLLPTLHNKGIIKYSVQSGDTDLHRYRNWYIENNKVFFEDSINLDSYNKKLEFPLPGNVKPKNFIPVPAYAVNDGWIVLQTTDGRYYLLDVYSEMTTDTKNVRTPKVYYYAVLLPQNLIPLKLVFSPTMSLLGSINRSRKYISFYYLNELKVNNGDIKGKNYQLIRLAPINYYNLKRQIIRLPDLNSNDGADILPRASDGYVYYNRCIFVPNKAKIKYLKQGISIKWGDLKTSGSKSDKFGDLMILWGKAVDPKLDAYDKQQKARKSFLVWNRAESVVVGEVLSQNSNTYIYGELPDDGSGAIKEHLTISKNTRWLAICRSNDQVTCNSIVGSLIFRRTFIPGGDYVGCKIMQAYLSSKSE